MFPMITTLADQKEMQFRGDLSEAGLKQTNNVCVLDIFLLL